MSGDILGEPLKLIGDTLFQLGLVAPIVGVGPKRLEPADVEPIFDVVVPEALLTRDRHVGRVTTSHLGTFASSRLLGVGSKSTFPCGGCCCPITLARVAGLDWHARGQPAYLRR